MQLKENVSEHTDVLKSQTRKQPLKDHMLAFFSFRITVDALGMIMLRSL